MVKLLQFLLFFCFQDRLFHVWLRIFRVRNITMEKRIQIQKMKHQMKLYQIIHPQMSLLNEWAKMERKNCEAVSRLTRKLSALSVKLPLAEEVKVVNSLNLGYHFCFYPEISLSLSSSSMSS